MTGWRMGCPPYRHLWPSTCDHTYVKNPTVPSPHNPDLSRQIHRKLPESARSLWVALRVNHASTDWADVSLGGREGGRERNVPRRRRPLPAGRRERRQVLDL